MSSEYIGKREVKKKFGNLPAALLHFVVYYASLLFKEKEKKYFKGYEARGNG